MACLRGALLVLALLCSACTASTSQANWASGAVGAAAFNAAVAGALWAVGPGCKFQGCPYGSWCNQETGFCEVTKCQDGCPEGTVCNEGLSRCQAPPPAKTPDDFLPQDRTINNLPGEH